MTALTCVEVTDLTILRGARALLGGLNFRANAGEATTITGVNGAGKTSLLRAMAGLIRPTDGAIRFVSVQGEMDAYLARREHCHLVGHADGLAPGRTAREELTFAVCWAGGDAASAHDGARRLGLERVLDLPVRQLSAGQRRRLVLVRLIAARRTLWLLDEPLTPLDAASRALIGEVMHDHLAGGGIIVAAVHDPLPIPACSIMVPG